MKAGAQTNLTTDIVLCANRGAGRGSPTALPVTPTLVLPRSTCLQESSAGSAQEHNGVVIDAGNRHRGQAAVGEHGGCCDGVHDGQWVLKVRCSTVQLLRLQLRRDTHVSGLQQTPAGPPRHRCLGLSVGKLLCPGKAPHYRVME